MKNIQKYNFKQGLPQEFEIINLDVLFKNFSNAMTSPHRAEFYQVIWIQEGNPIHTIDFKQIKINPNSFIFINKGSVQQFDSSINYKGKVILFTDSFFCKTQLDSTYLRNSILFNDLHSTSEVCLSHSTPIFSELFHIMEQELSKGKDQYQSDILRNALRITLLQTERIKREQGFTEIKKSLDLDQVMQFRTLLDSQFTDHKQVQFYAESMYITKKRLNQSTSNILGITPKQMIDARVVLEAKRLLAHTNISVKEIGFKLGFEEPTNFIKYFKKHVLSTPLEFRTYIN
mgnify:CR=1 FL=1